MVEDFGLAVAVCRVRAGCETGRYREQGDKRIFGGFRPAFIRAVCQRRMASIL
jgi:hypothetical protein